MTNINKDNSEENVELEKVEVEDIVVEDKVVLTSQNAALDKVLTSSRFIVLVAGVAFAAFILSLIALCSNGNDRHGEFRNDHQNFQSGHRGNHGGPAQFGERGNKAYPNPVRPGNRDQLNSPDAYGTSGDGTPPPVVENKDK